MHIYSYIAPLLLAMMLLLGCGVEPATGQTPVSSDSLGLGDVFLWNTPLIYTNILGPNSGVDVQVFSHQLQRGTHALAVRNLTVLEQVNVIRSGLCYVAKPRLSVQSNQLRWTLIWYTDPYCSDYKLITDTIQDHMQSGVAQHRTTPLEQLPDH